MTVNRINPSSALAFKASKPFDSHLIPTNFLK